MNQINNKLFTKTGGLALMLPVFIIFLTSFSSAARPDFIQDENTGGFVIDGLIYDTIKQDQDFNFHIHVYNQTSGINVSNLTVKCYTHVYNSLGTHIVKNQMDYESYGDFELVINKGNFTEPGQYALEVWCVGGAFGGAERIYFDVVESTKSNYKLFILLGIIAIILLFFSIYVEDYWITAFSGLIFTALGLYALVNGLDGFKNSTTSAMSILITFFGIYTMVKAGMEYTK